MDKDNDETSTIRSFRSPLFSGARISKGVAAVAQSGTEWDRTSFWDRLRCFYIAKYFGDAFSKCFDLCFALTTLDNNNNNNNEYNNNMKQKRYPKAIALFEAIRVAIKKSSRCNIVLCGGIHPRV
ncbi:hypothetical protein RFI_32641 [Reticulomyxa filosa]|uniref:Uncharacterized protein n=1 Tax=Reticulomyxa filosa TaxID=46433 RepID=X6LTQ5_RETFI|nr:hypothetical protein RFI_32641 [Reticulomyxa filosa]|eukprot:ETO04756.1 hypothetical protein RFI_32641 [Reticulomyxa filosa]